MIFVRVLHTLQTRSELVDSPHCRRAHHSVPSVQCLLTGVKRMTTETPPEEEKFANILQPYTLRRHKDALEKGTRFVHYTSAAAAMNILRSKEVWMRKSSCMDDFSEVEYGMTHLSQVFRETESGKNFQQALNQIFPGIAEEVAELFDNWRLHFITDTYFTCVSEHDVKEDTFGRLSMWRAYSEETGVALVLNNSVFVNPSPGFAAYAIPVAYLNVREFEIEFGRIAKHISDEAAFIGSRTREEIKTRMFYMFRFASVAMKHPGFREEREWRIVYCPPLEQSPYLKKEIQVVKGVPQPIYKIPLKNIPEVSLVAAIPDLLERLIIGPTEYRNALREAFSQLLADVGVQSPETRIYTSDIPLRR
jgi:hypothetical protein